MLKAASERARVLALILGREDGRRHSHGSAMSFCACSPVPTSSMMIASFAREPAGRALRGDLERSSALPEAWLCAVEFIEFSGAEFAAVKFMSGPSLAEFAAAKFEEVIEFAEFCELPFAEFVL